MGKFCFQARYLFPVNIVILSFLRFDLGQNKVAMAFGQCPVVKYMIQTSHGTQDCPLRTFGWPLGGPHSAWYTGNSQKKAPNHQIVLFPPLKQATPSFPIIEYFISTFYGTLGHSLEALGDPQGLLGAPQSLNVAKKGFKSSDIFLSIIQMSTTRFSHSQIIPQ